MLVPKFPINALSNPGIFKKKPWRYPQFRENVQAFPRMSGKWPIIFRNFRKKPGHFHEFPEIAQTFSRFPKLPEMPGHFPEFSKNDRAFPELPENARALPEISVRCPYFSGNFPEIVRAFLVISYNFPEFPDNA